MKGNTEEVIKKGRRKCQ